MSDIKRLPERLECMVFRVRFPEEVEELQPVSWGAREREGGFEEGREGGKEGGKQGEKGRGVRMRNILWSCKGERVRMGRG